MGAALGPILGAVGGGGDEQGYFNEEQGQAGFGGGAQSGGGGAGQLGGMLAGGFGGQGQQPRSGPPPSQAPQGFDMATPGVAEQTFQNTQGQWNQPSMSSNYFAAAAPAMFNGNTNSQTAFNNFQAGPHDFGAYYDRAKTRTLGSMNDQAAARGVYGSSPTLNAIGDASAAIDSDRANREATYNLQRAQTAGALGAGADSSNMARYGLGGSLAQGADSMEYNRLGGMMNAAGMAQDARRTRGRDYMSDIYQPTAMAMGITQQSLDAQIAEENALMDAIAALQLGAAGQGVAQSQYLDAQARGDFGAGLEAAGQIFNPLG